MSLRKAINAKCRDCIYDPLSGLGNWRQQIGLCAIQTCSLWPYRPVSKPKPQMEAKLARLEEDAA